MAMKMIPATAMSVLLHAATLGLPSGALPFLAMEGAHGETPASTNAPLRVSLPTSRSLHLASIPAKQGERTVEESRPARIRASRTESIGILEGPRYFGPSELSRRARAIGDIETLPADLERVANSGHVILQLRISATGTVDDVRIQQATLDDAIANAIKDRFSRLRFHPAEIDGKAVNSRMKIEVIMAPPRGA